MRYGWRLVVALAFFGARAEEHEPSHKQQEPEHYDAACPHSGTQDPRIHRWLIGNPRFLCVTRGTSLGVLGDRRRAEPARNEIKLGIRHPANSQTSITTGSDP